MRSCPLEAVWSVGEWGACNATCGGGAQTRTVECVLANGTAAAHSACVGAAPAASAPCGVAPCNFCELAALCSGHGNCSAAAQECVCDAGFSGEPDELTVTNAWSRRVAADLS